MRSFIKNKEGEIWKPVVGYEDRFFVSNSGRVRSASYTFMAGRGCNRTMTKIIKKPRLVAQPKMTSGYPTVNLAGKTFCTHVLVLEAFRGLKPSPNSAGEKYEACHINDVKDDNRLENLRWGTYSENIHDRRRNGIACVGEKKKNAKLTYDRVDALRIEKATTNISYKEMAKRECVSVRTLHMAITKVTWRR